MAEAELEHCPVCGVETIPAHDELEYEDKLCDACYAKANSESAGE